MKKLKNLIIKLGNKTKNIKNGFWEVCKVFSYYPELFHFLMIIGLIIAIVMLIIASLLSKIETCC